MTSLPNSHWKIVANTRQVVQYDSTSWALNRLTCSIKSTHPIHASSSSCTTLPQQHYADTRRSSQKQKALPARAERALAISECLERTQFSLRFGTGASNC